MHDCLVLGDGPHAMELQENLATHFGSQFQLVSREDEEALLSGRVRSVVIGVGEPRIREAIIRRWYGEFSASFLTVINRNADVAGSALVGGGCVIQAGAIVSTRAELGLGCLVNWNATVGHETIIGTGSAVAPGANIGGRCKIGAGVMIGAGAVVLPSITIGDHAVIGAGAVVTRDVEPGVTVVGNPARVTSTDT